MLAYPLEEKRLRKWLASVDFVICQPKLDGERCRALIDEEGNVLLLSSEENPIFSVPHIKQALELTGLKDIELDGELYSLELNKDEIRSRVGRTRNLHPQYHQISYWVFDVIGEETQLDRQSILLNLETQLVMHPSLQVITPEVARDMEEVMQHYHQFINSGFEGIIVRDPRAFYKRSRSTEMMKFKPSETGIFTVVGYEEEISIHGEPKGTLGALLCVDDKGEEFSVGSGLTRDNRVGLWAIRDELIGVQVKINYQHLTPKRKVPRHPVFAGIIRQ